MSLTCPHCHQPFTLVAVAHPVAAAPPAPAPAPFQFTSPPNDPIPWVCNVHRRGKVVPAGVSKKTGKPYAAFWACPEQGCEIRPPRGYPVPSTPPVEELPPPPMGLDELP